MNCVVCKEPMVVLELDEVEIDHCLTCRGIWLDSGELELLLGDPAEVNSMLAQLAANEEAASGKRRCPICRKKMEIVSVSGERPVRIDRCRKHHGLWFDSGELEEVLTAFDIDKHSKALSLLRDMFASRKQD